MERTPKNLAPGECFFKRLTKTQTTYRRGDLKTVVKPVTRHQVAVLSGENRPGPEPSRGCRNRGSQCLERFRGCIACLGLADKRNLVRGDVYSIDPAVRFDFANERLIKRIAPDEAHTSELRRFDSATLHQVLGHADY